MSQTFNVDNILKLIYLYRANECLWKITSKSYSRKDIKNNALKQIADEFNVTTEEIKRKIRNLRNMYVQQKKKIEKDKTSGNGVDELPKHKWFLFDELTFLDEVVVLRKTSSNYDTKEEENTFSLNNSWDIAVSKEAESGEIYEEDTNEFYQEENIQETNKNVTKKAEKFDKYDAAIAKLVTSKTSPKKQTNIFESFSSTVGIQLQEIYKLDASEAFSTMRDIQILIGNKLTTALKNKQIEISTYETCPSETNTIWAARNRAAKPSPMKTTNNDRPTQSSAFKRLSGLRFSDTSSSINLTSPNLFNKISPTPSDSPTNLPTFTRVPDSEYSSSPSNPSDTSSNITAKLTQIKSKTHDSHTPKSLLYFKNLNDHSQFCDTSTSSTEFNSSNLFNNISPTPSESSTRHFQTITRVTSTDPNYSSSPPNFKISKPQTIKSETNVSYTPPLYSGHLIEPRCSPKKHVLPESKRVKILEDVRINYDTSCLLQNAMMLSGIEDF